MAAEAEAEAAEAEAAEALGHVRLAMPSRTCRRRGHRLRRQDAHILQAGGAARRPLLKPKTVRPAVRSTRVRRLLKMWTFRKFRKVSESFGRFGRFGHDIEVSQGGPTSTKWKHIAVGQATLALCV